MARKKNTRQFVVTVNVPEGVTLSEMTEYIREAVAVWKGQIDPNQMMFWLDGDSVKVKRLPQTRPVKT